MFLVDLYAAVQWPGLKVSTEGGWRTRGHGGMASRPRTVVVHHTAGGRDESDRRVVRDGHSALAGPLSQLLLHTDGTARLVAAGKCWHAGRVYDDAHGNSHAVGIEAVHDGVSHWPGQQYDAYVLLCAALVRHYNLRVTDVLGHKEIAKPKGRKSDPNFDMDTFRERVAAEAQRTLHAGDRLVMVGSHGPDVAEMQAIVKADVDGDFGPATERAVKEWQAGHGLDADGIVGPGTWGKLLATPKPAVPVEPNKPAEPVPVTKPDPINWDALRQRVVETGTDLDAVQEKYDQAVAALINATQHI